MALLGVLDFPKFEHRPALNPIKVRNQKRGLIFLKIYIYMEDGLDSIVRDVRNVFLIISYFDVSMKLCTL